MYSKFKLNHESNRILLDLNQFIHNGTELGEYHMNHLDLQRKYATEILKKLSVHFDSKNIEAIALAHDLFKERSLNKDNGSVEWQGLSIPQDTNRYVRMNLDILEEYGLDEYFNTDIQLHPLSALIFMVKELDIKDLDVLYPVVFHSCPIISIYETLNPHLQAIIDVTTLADKLSSNYLKINEREKKVYTDLDQIVFGTSGREFNYTLGLFVARLISQGLSVEKQSLITTDYYYKRLQDINPLIYKKCSILKLGGKKKWPKRNSLLWKTQ